jgi:hypothetical protein
MTWEQWQEFLASRTHARRLMTLAAAVHEPADSFPSSSVSVLLMRSELMSEPLLSRARDGDELAFRELTDPYRRELDLHCYRILGSLQDAEDMLQETLLAAWRSLDEFQGRASLRTWL